MEQRPRLQLFTPAARIVTGNVQKPNLNDMHGRPRDKPQYFFGVAFPKNHPDCGAMFQAMHDFAAAQYAYYPDVVRRINALWQVGPKGCGFAFKFEDGDVPHPQKGIREGYAGCWVMKFTSTYPIRTCNLDNHDVPPAHVLTGYLVDVAFNITINQKTDHTAGLFLNPVFVRLLSQAQAIVGGPQAGQVFQGRQAPTHELGNFRAALAPVSGVPGAGGGGGYPGGPGGMAPHPSQTIGGPGPMAHPGHTQGAYGNGGGQSAPAQGQQAGGGGGFMYPSGQGNPTINPMGAGAPSAPSHQPMGAPGMSMLDVAEARLREVGGGGQNAPANPPQAHTMPSLPGAPSGVSNAPSSPDTGAVMSPGVTHTSSPSDQPGNAPNAGGPAVPGGASVVHAPSTVPGQGSPIVSPSNAQPHPQFVHGGQAA